MCVVEWCQGFHQPPSIDLTTWFARPQQAGAVLDGAQQTSEEQRDALADVSEILGRKDILSHKDKASNRIHHK